MDKFLLTKLEAYIKSGGKVLATGKSGLCKEGGTYPKEFGAEYLGCADMCPDYIRPKFPLKSMNSSSFVMYSGGVRVKNRNGKCIAFRQNPYFERTVLHFSSHKIYYFLSLKSLRYDLVLSIISSKSFLASEIESLTRGSFTNAVNARSRSRVIPASAMISCSPAILAISG